MSPRGTAALALAASLVTASALGCDANEERVAGPAARPTADVDAAAGEPAAVQQSATGHADIFGPVTGFHWVYSISAINHPDGTTTGEYEEHTYVTATGELVRKTHAHVTCLTVVGNTAYVGGVVDRSTDPTVVPDVTEGVLTLVDNGEGKNDPPDLASAPLGGGPGLAARHCTTHLRRALLPVEKGNIQVRE